MVQSSLSESCDEGNAMPSETCVTCKKPTTCFVYQNEDSDSCI
jgi:hypothetical protein